MFKKATSLLMAVAILIASCLSASLIAHAEQSSDYAEQKALVETYWEKVDLGKWSDWANLYAPVVRDKSLCLVNKEENHLNNVGLLTVSSVELCNVELVGDDFASMIYKELIPYYDDPNTVACYFVDLDMTVNVDNGYFSNGKSRQVMILVKDNGVWYAGAIYPYSGDDLQTKGIAQGFLDYAPEPSTIRVADEDGRISTVTLSDFLFNAICNEIGNMGFDNDAVYANVLALKMLGWWCATGHAYGSYGYDIGYGLAAYCSYNNATSANQTKMRQAIAKMEGIRMTCIVNGKEKLFGSTHAAGDYNAKYEASGILRQKGSHFLATNSAYGYNWRQILEFYYNNSNYNHTPIDKITIKHTGSHSYGSYISDPTYHWRVCSRCFTSGSRTTHKWVVHTGYTSCSVCGRIQNTVSPNLMDWVFDMHPICK